MLHIVNLSGSWVYSYSLETHDSDIYTKLKLRHIVQPLQNNFCYNGGDSGTEACKEKCTNGSVHYIENSLPPKLVTQLKPHFIKHKDDGFP